MSITLYYFLAFCGLYILLGWSIYIVYRIGQFNNAPIVTMAIGAYFTGIATRYWHWPFVLALLMSIIIGGIFSFIIGASLARSSAFSMSIATISLIFVVQVIIRNNEFLGKNIGFYNIPKVNNLLVIIYIFVLIIGTLVFRFEYSKLGRAASSILFAKDLSYTLGIDIYWYSVSLQVFSGIIGAIAGSLYAPLMFVISPYNFSLTLLFYIYTFLFVGGPTTMWGVLISTPLLWSISIIFPQKIVEWQISIYSIILILILLIRPKGLIDKKIVSIFNIKKYFK